MKNGIIMEINKRFLIVLTPEGEFLRARKLHEDYQIGQEISFVPIEEKKNTFLFSFSGKVTLAACTLSLIIFSMIPFYQDTQVYAYMSIDINPSIELGVNSDFEVIQLTPYNDDGEKIVNKLREWNRKDVANVTYEILRELKSQGYIKQNGEVVISTVYTEEEDKKKHERLEKEINTITKTIHKQENVDIVLVEGTQKEREIAKEQGLTTGLYIDHKLKSDETHPLRESNHMVTPKTSQEKAKIAEEKSSKQIDQPIQKKVEQAETSNSNIPPGQVKKEEKIKQSEHSKQAETIQQQKQKEQQRLKEQKQKEQQEKQREKQEQQQNWKEQKQKEQQEKQREKQEQQQNWKEQKQKEQQEKQREKQEQQQNWKEQKQKEQQEKQREKQEQQQNWKEQKQKEQQGKQREKEHKEEEDHKKADSE